MLRLTALSLAVLALCVVVQSTHIPSCSSCHSITSPSDKYPCNCNEVVVRPAPQQCCPCAALPFKIKCPHAHCSLYGKHHLYYKPALLDFKYNHVETASPVNPCCHDSKYVPAAKPCCKVCKSHLGYSKNLLDLGYGKLHYHDASGVHYHDGDLHEYTRYTAEPNYYHHGRYDRVAAYNHDDVHGYMVRDDALVHPSHDFYHKGIKSYKKAALIPRDFGVHPHEPVEYVRDGDEHTRLNEDFLDADEAKRYTSGEINAKTGLTGCRSRQPVDMLSLTLVRNAALKAERAAEVKEEGLAYGFRQQPKEVKKAPKKDFEEESKLAAYDKDVIELKKFHSPTILKEETFEYEDYPGDAHIYDAHADTIKHKITPSYDDLGFKKVDGACGRTVSTCVHHDQVEYKVPAQPCINPQCRAEKCDCY